MMDSSGKLPKDTTALKLQIQDDAGSGMLDGDVMSTLVEVEDEAYDSDIYIYIYSSPSSSRHRS